MLYNFPCTFNLGWTPKTIKCKVLLEMEGIYYTRTILKNKIILKIKLLITLIKRLKYLIYNIIVMSMYRAWMQKSSA